MKKEEIELVNNYIIQAIKCINNKEWLECINLCDKVLDINPGYSLAYEYKLMAEAKVKTIGELPYSACDIENLETYESFLKYGSPEIVKFVIRQKSIHIQNREEKILSSNTKDIGNQSSHRKEEKKETKKANSYDYNKIQHSPVKKNVSRSGEFVQRKNEPKKNVIEDDVRKKIHALPIIIVLLCLLLFVIIGNLWIFKDKLFHKHAWNEATCVFPRICLSCGETEGEAKGHTWVEATCDTPKTCSICGETEGGAKGHAWVEATCANPKVCAVCGETNGVKIGHDVEIGICKRCGEVVGTEIVLELKNNLDKVNACFGDTKNVHGEEAIYSYICSQGTDNKTAKQYLRDVADFCNDIADLSELKRKSEEVIGCLPTNSVSKGDTESYISFLKKQQEADLKMAELSKEFADIAKKMQK